MLILHGEQPVLFSQFVKKIGYSVAAHQCAALTCHAVRRRVEVASFKLPSVDVRLGANEAPGDAVRVRLSSSSNKG